MLAGFQSAFCKFSVRNHKVKISHALWLPGCVQCTTRTKSCFPQKVQRTTHRHLTSLLSWPCAAHYPHKIQLSTESAAHYPPAPHFSPFLAMCSALPAQNTAFHRKCSALPTGTSLLSFPGHVQRTTRTRSCVPQKVQRTTHRHLTSLLSRQNAAHYPHTGKNWGTGHCCQGKEGMSCMHFLKAAPRVQLVAKSQCHTVNLKTMSGSMPKFFPCLKHLTGTLMCFAANGCCSHAPTAKGAYHTVFKWCAPRRSLWSNLSAAPSTCRT